MYHWIDIKHRENVWEKYPITHVQLCRGVVADTTEAKLMIRHIRDRADADGVASIEEIAPGFPALRKNSLPLREAMLKDLRHMANDRKSGENSSNKGLLRLGWIVSQHESAVQV